MIEASACAKFILFGEHAAVYGYPVIALPLSTMRARAELSLSDLGSGLKIISEDLGQSWVLTDLELAPSSPLLYLAYRLIQQAGLECVPDVHVKIRSDIPVASGLGSGASVSVALARVLLKYLGLEFSLSQLNAFVYDIERFYHGNPSGVDNTVIVYEQPVYFVRGLGIRLFDFPLSQLMVIDSGISASTMAAVADVRMGYLHLDLGSFVSEMGRLFSSLLPSFASSDVVHLGRLMLQNHVLLQSIGVSHEVLDRIVFLLLESGVSGVKLSGGGQGGNLVASCSLGVEAQFESVASFAGATSVVPLVGSNDYKKN
ncbi:MAG: mevalonate kinase [Anaerolineae bacterium]|nr:mevalonate kinase [Anaerolineae bacterium]